MHKLFEVRNTQPHLCTSAIYLLTLHSEIQLTHTADSYLMNHKLHLEHRRHSSLYLLNSYNYTRYLWLFQVLVKGRGGNQRWIGFFVGSLGSVYFVVCPCCDCCLVVCVLDVHIFSAVWSLVNALCAFRFILLLVSFAFGWLLCLWGCHVYVVFSLVGWLVFVCCP